MGLRRRIPARVASHDARRVRRSVPAAPVDPVALTLAVWLGMIAFAGGIMRLAEEPAVQAAFTAPGRPDPAHAAGQVPLDYRDFAFGG